MNEQITSAAELDALRRAAQRFIVAYDRMVEINQGIGGLAAHEPRLYEDFIAWNHASDYYHADTVLALFAQQHTVAEVKAEALREAGKWFLLASQLGTGERDEIAAQACFDRADRIEREVRP